MNGKSLLLLGVITGAVILLCRKSSAFSSSSKVLLTDFINPASVAGIAAQLPTNEDEFIIAAHKYVTDHVRYDGFETTLKLTPDFILCQLCYLPVTVLNRGKSNCVGMSVLLESILRNRIPANRTYAVVGQLRQIGNSGGHCWVQVQRSGIWYIIESTLPPTGQWKRASDWEDTYQPEALVNDVGLICVDPELCVNIKRARCSCEQKAVQVLY